MLSRGPRVSVRVLTLWPPGRSFGRRGDCRARARRSGGPDIRGDDLTTRAIQSGFQAGSPRGPRSSMIFQSLPPFNGAVAVSAVPAPVTRSRGLRPNDTRGEPLIDVAGQVSHEAGRRPSAESSRPDPQSRRRPAGSGRPETFVFRRIWGHSFVPHARTRPASISGTRFRRGSPRCSRRRWSPTTSGPWKDGRTSRRLPPWTSILRGVRPGSRASMAEECSP